MMRSDQRVSRMLWGVLLALATLIAGCGVSPQREAVTTRPEDVPFGLGEPSIADPPQPAPSDAGATAEVFFLDATGSRLVRLTREVSSGSVTEVMGALLAGPTVGEIAEGLTTALPDEDLVRATEVAGGVAAVDLAAEFVNLDAAAQRAALAQIVFTVTARPGVGRVAFTLEGQPTEIPRGDGTLTTGSVSRDSYRELQPAEPPPG